MDGKCLLTGREVQFKLNGTHLCYSLNFAGKEVDIFICDNCKKNIDFNVSAHIVEGLIANEKWPERIELVSEDCTLSTHIEDCETVVLQEYLRTADYPKSPKEKLDNLILYLFNLQKYVVVGKIRTEIWKQLNFCTNEKDKTQVFGELQD